MSLLSRLAVQAARAYGILSSNPNNVPASYLAVAGGGAGAGSVGGVSNGGGGGAGGLLASTFTLSTLNTYSITVGAGGVTNANGSNSVVSGTGITTVTSIGGGAGGYNNVAGANGGSGGGGGAGVSIANGSGTSGQGFAGGVGFNGSNYGAGGGGGASAVGVAGTGSTGGNGGAGTASSISGSSVTYAGGGGGGINTGSTAGSGGAGGGGAGGSSSPFTGTAGTVNTGGGGGGGGNGGSNTAAGGAGGSGIVIISYASATPRFVGGTLTTSGGNQIHTFTSSGTLSPITPITASYLVVAGGGGGGAANGGGGGAGGFLTNSTTIYSGATYIVTVGAGGSGGAHATGTGATNGSNSVLSGTGITTVTSIGGGLGGSYAQAAASGGSGGGASNGTNTGGTGTSGQGNNGGSTTSTSTGNFAATGGGGAGAAGASLTGNGNATNGGIGLTSSITGTSTYYAGGGGGGANGGSNSSGGLGGGGAGAVNNPGTSGTANTGGGGGGSAGSNNGALGGSGIVIISYAGSQAFNGGLVTSSGGNTIHTFTSTGALTPLTNNLTNSLRFRASASARLTRTFATTGTNNKIQTFSAWVKRGLLSSSTDYRLMGGYDGTSSNSTEINFDNDSLRIEFGGAANNPVITTQVFRDPSAWYHIVIAIDTTQATAANRIKMYVNGNQITAFSTATYPSQNALSQLTSANANNSIGSGWSGFEYFDGYMTDINFIDGQALEPYYFGNNDANGVWKPILYKGTYGTNGFYLTFGNTTSTTTLGYDSSPNGNNWTTNNISLTAGATYDAMTDVPTNTSATVANYCVLNQLNKNANVTVSNASLTSTSAVSNAGISGTMYVKSSGKYYWEATCTTNTTYPIVGIVNEAWSSGTNALTYPGATSGSYGYANDGLKYNNGSTASYGASYTSGDIIGVALDLDAGTLTFYKNNISQGTAYTGLTDSYAPAVSGQASDVWNMNFGQRPFSYTPPTGFVRLNTFNLPTPTILQGNKYMDATLATGNNSTQVIVNQAQFRPDFVWLKIRSASENHIAYDSVRGAQQYLIPNLTSAEATLSSGLTSFNSNGFTLGNANPNYSGSPTFVGWQWQAGQGSTSSNTSGSITSTVSASTTAGFSIVTYTGTGANATVGHGLGVAPKMVIVKNRTAGGAGYWITWHTSLTSAAYYVALQDTFAQASDATVWNSTAPTSSVFSIGTNTTSNNSGTNFVAYCWAEIAGFSKFGSYTGNANADGPFIYTGFRPKFVMIKSSSVGGAGYYWTMYDTSRNTYNVADLQLCANLSDAEAVSNQIDILSNGFKIFGSGTRHNGSGTTYIYMAFAENPFKNANAR